MSGAASNNNNGGAAAAEGLDFDRLALERRTERVAKAGREWWLRWDIPAEVMVQRLLLKEIPERARAIQAEVEALGGEAETQAEDFRERMVREWQDYSASVLRICHLLFAHSDQHITADEVNAHFSTNEQRAIIEHFFTLPTRRSSLPQTAGSAASTQMPASSPSQGQTTSSHRGATPRRKR